MAKVPASLYRTSDGCVYFSVEELLSEEGADYVKNSTVAKYELVGTGKVKSAFVFNSKKDK